MSIESIIVDACKKLAQDLTTILSDATLGEIAALAPPRNKPALLRAPPATPGISKTVRTEPVTKSNKLMVSKGATLAEKNKAVGSLVDKALRRVKLDKTSPEVITRVAQVLRYINTHKNAGSGAMQKALKMDRRTIALPLKKLKSAGLIRKSGATKSTVWNAA